MKLLIALVLIVSACCLVSAAPNLDYLTEEQCRSCHGDTDGKTHLTIHHTDEMFEVRECWECHANLFAPNPPLDWRSCYHCHDDYNHHEGAERQCYLCHDDKQKGKNWK